MPGFRSICIVAATIVLGLNTVNCQQQYFRVRPQDKEVVAGHQVDLQCHVANQAGAVQWAKDGFVLGFDPEIPGYPRYTMTVDEKRGVYNLRLKNTQLDDEGDYQCQVGPGTNNKPIRTQAHVTVLVPPKEVIVQHRSNSSVVEVREAERVSLKCTARGSKPPTNLRWFRNGVELSQESLSTVVESAGDRKHSTISVITIYAKLDDHGAVYACQAEHPALPRPIRATVTVSVLYPPGPPEIEGYQEGDIIQVGDTLTLACISRGGNPPAKLVWFRNGAQVDHTYTTGGREATNTHTFSVDASDNNALYRCEASNDVTLHPLVAIVKLSVLFAPSRVTISGPSEGKVGDTVTLTCTAGPSNPAAEVSWVVDGRPVLPPHATALDAQGGWITTSNLTVTLTRQDPDTKTFSCYAVSETLGETIVQTYTLNILYPPGPPSIMGYSEGTALRAGELHRFSCVSLGGNPFASLRWFKGDREISALTSASSSGVSSELVIRAEPSDNGAIYRCEASNPATLRPLMASITTKVIYASTSVKIEVKPKKPKAGEAVIILCDSGSCNPDCTIQWWKDGEVIMGQHDGIIDGAYGGKVTRSRISFNTTAGDDGSVFTCQATNLQLQRSTHQSMTLHVLYKPVFLIPPMEKFEVIEGASLEINLTAKGNPPLISYAWWKDGVPLLDASDDLSWGRSGSTPGHRVISRGPLLEVSHALREDGGEYDCEAANSEGATRTTIVLNVLYPATITKVTEITLANYGDDARLDCFATANPLTLDLIQWRREGFDMRRTQTTVERGRSSLVVLNVSRNDSGLFECVAYNGIGEEVNKSAKLLVKFKPEIRRHPRFLKVAGEEGETGRLICQAEGVPEVSFYWMYKHAVVGEGSGVFKYALQTTQIEDIAWECSLYIKRLMPEDFGSYTCVARNSLGEDRMETILKRRGPPDPPEDLKVINVTHESVYFTWVPGFNGGLEQKFRFRYYILESTNLQYDDVPYSNTSGHKISNLIPGMDYAFQIFARNALGESEINPEVKVTTLMTSVDDSPNAVIARDKAKGDMPKVLLVVTLVVGTLLLLLNAVLVFCFIRWRKNKRQRTEAGPISSVDKCDTQMYTPSKYQETINGEALRPLGTSRENTADPVVLKTFTKEEGTLRKKSIIANSTIKDPHKDELLGLRPKTVSIQEDNCPDVIKNRTVDDANRPNITSSLLSPSSNGNNGDKGTVNGMHKDPRYVTCSLERDGVTVRSAAHTGYPGDDPDPLRSQDILCPIPPPDQYSSNSDALTIGRSEGNFV